MRVLERVKERLQEPRRRAPAPQEIELSHDVLVVKLAAEHVLPTVQTLRSEFAFDSFTDVTAVDWPAQVPRFEVVWHLYSTRHFARVRLKTRVPERDPTVDSLVSIYGAARFMERECHEMYGIVFRGNPDLRPLLLYEGFAGHPLRKDYPKKREQPLVAYRMQSEDANSNSIGWGEHEGAGPAPSFRSSTGDTSKRQAPSA